MANNPAARKRDRQSKKRRARNNQRLKSVRTLVRKVRSAQAAHDESASELAQHAERQLRKAGSKGMLHRRTIDRTVSRLRRLVGS
ncbi:MAG: 30S ribosomal protein S20 [Myxococcota bacterium]